jgi:alpha-L-fucosidase 2
LRIDRKPEPRAEVIFSEGYGMNRRAFLLAMAHLAAAADMAPAAARAEENNSEWPRMRWWYRSPASRYWEGVPLSNGRLAAMVSGGVEDEVISLNEESLWSGSPYGFRPGLPAIG